MLNQIALNFAKYYPEPTSAGNPYTATNNFFARGSVPSLGHKLDENISEKQRLSARL